MSDRFISVTMPRSLHRGFRNLKEDVFSDVSYQELMSAVIMYTSASASVPGLVARYDIPAGSYRFDTHAEGASIDNLDRRLGRKGISNRSRALRSVMAWMVDSADGVAAIDRMLP